jgi:ABC-2 type transport system permease protein
MFFALIKKELRLYFNSPIAYIFLVAFLVVSMWFFFRGFFLINQAEIRSFFVFLPWILMFLIPALTMRLWSEEYRQGTIETLLTSSLSLPVIILGKFLSSFIFIAIALGATLILPISIALIGPLDFGVVTAAYFGSLFLSLAFLALGLFVSSITNNQIVAFIISIFLIFLFLIIGSDIVIYTLPSFLAVIANFFSLSTHYESIIRGVIDTRDLIYYLSFIGFFLYLNYHILDAKK